MKAQTVPDSRGTRPGMTDNESRKPYAAAALVT